MKLRIFLVLITIGLMNIGLSAQTVDVGTNFTTSNAPFYKDVPGLQLGFYYHFKRQFVFTELKSSLKNNSYTISQAEWSPGSKSYTSQRVNGKLFVNTLKLGIAQKIKNSEAVCISLGAFASMNYFKFDDQIVTYEYIEMSEGNIWHRDGNELVKNRWGLGCFIDMEIKQVFLKNTSLFSRIGMDYIELVSSKNIQRGLSFQTNNMTSLEFALGLRFDLKKKK